MRRLFLLWQDKASSLGVKFSLVFLLLALGYLFITFHRWPPEVPLFYSRPWGEEQLANSDFLWLLPSGALLIAFLNISLAAFLIEEFPFLARILAWSTTLISFLASIAIFKIVTLIT